MVEENNYEWREAGEEGKRKDGLVHLGYRYYYQFDAMGFYIVGLEPGQGATNPLEGRRFTDINLAERALRNVLMTRKPKPKAKKKPIEDKKAEFKNGT